jgi:hypothetical protein
MTRLQVLFAACMILLLGASCGDSDSSENETANPETDPVLSDAPATPLPSPVAALREQLLRRMLGLEDLPAGWTLLSTDEHPHRGSVFCDIPFEAGTAPLFRLTRVFQKGEAGTVLSQRISAYPEGGAESVMREFREATDDCKEWTKVTDTGSQTWKLFPLEMQSFGDDMIALDLPTTVGSVTIDNHFVMLREGDVITILGYGGPFVDQIDPSETEDIARSAAAKLE